MKKLSAAALGAALLAPLAPGATAHADTGRSVVETSQGAVRGVVGEAARSFRGIPYATAERFAAPRPAPGWAGVRDATAAGAPCAQPAGPPIGEYSTADDCLTLNVTTPVAGGGKRPVIVWVHGGSLMYGMGGLYGAERLAAGGAVVVSMNYRLGAAAFLTHPALPESGALALDDQRAALRWVRGNIAAFGGDPRNVTLMGQSGGGFTVCGHLASPASAGLFDKAIVQSAPCGVPGNASRTRAEALDDSDEVVEELTEECPEGVGVARCLRETPMEELLKAYGSREPRPVSGTPQLPLPVDEAFRTGRFNRVPVLIGVNHDEENGMVLGEELVTGEPMTDEAYVKEIREKYGRRARAVLGRYPLGDSAGRSLARVKTDEVWAAPTLDTARTLARRTSVRMYEFAERDTPWYANYPAPSFPAAAQHMAELAYIFDLGLFEGLTAEQAALADRLVGAWTRFAATGDPNGGGEAVWPRLRDDRGRAGRYVQSLTSGTWERADFERDHEYRFWSRG